MSVSNKIVLLIIALCILALLAVDVMYGQSVEIANTTRMTTIVDSTRWIVSTDSSTGGGTVQVPRQILWPTLVNQMQDSIAAGGVAAGSDKHIQYNSSGGFGADSNFQWWTNGLVLYNKKNINLLGATPDTTIGVKIKKLDWEIDTRYYGFFVNFDKDAGANANGDDYVGVYSWIDFSDADEECDIVGGTYNVGFLVDGIADDVYGSFNYAGAYDDTIRTDLIGGSFTAYTRGGLNYVGGDVSGAEIFTNNSATNIVGDLQGLKVSNLHALGTVTTNMYGIYITHNHSGGTVSGTEYGLYIDDASSTLDYGAAIEGDVYLPDGDQFYGNLEKWERSIYITRPDTLPTDTAYAVGNPLGVTITIDSLWIEHDADSLNLKIYRKDKGTTTRITPYTITKMTTQDTVICFQTATLPHMSRLGIGEATGQDTNPTYIIIHFIGKYTKAKLNESGRTCGIEG